MPTSSHLTHVKPSLSFTARLSHLPAGLLASTRREWWWLTPSPERARSKESLCVLIWVVFTDFHTPHPGNLPSSPDRGSSNSSGLSYEGRRGPPPTHPSICVSFPNSMILAFNLVKLKPTSDSSGTKCGFGAGVGHGHVCWFSRWTADSNTTEACPPKSSGPQFPHL